MEFNFNMRGRRSIRLKGRDYSVPGDYFVTICVYQMECVLGKFYAGRMRLSEAGEIASREWRSTETVRPEVTLGPFVVMPNHLHGVISIHARRDDPILIPNVGATRRVALPLIYRPMAEYSASQWVPPILKPNTIGAIIGQFKSLSTKKITSAGLIAFHWQRNYYERIIRGKHEFKHVTNYILENPSNWPEDPDNPDNFRNV